jgi:3D (Asp-Asp-Asp) domain-containing protein
MATDRRSQPGPATDPADAPSVRRKRRAAAWLAAGLAGFALMLGWSSWQAFTRVSHPPALAAVEADVERPARAARPGVAWPAIEPADEQDDARDPQAPSTAPPSPAAAPTAAADPRHPSQTRAAGLIVDGQPWTGPTFDGRPIRPVRTVTMRTTAYSPDARSCGKWADGITASGMSVWTNGMKLAAADPSIPFGTILTVPGYNDGQPIPVLDRGGAIKGHRLDLLYPTHDIALQWGVQDLEVVVWEYADE